MIITSKHEDYLEVIFRLNQSGQSSVKVTDLANALGCRLPTVTRTVQTLTDHGYLIHEHRSDISLSKKGVKIAEQITHRHDDIEDFLHRVLGLDANQAKIDACKIEHGFSALASQRLHAFMNYFDQLNSNQKQLIQQAVTSNDNSTNLFDSIQKTKTDGWRY